MVANTKVVRVYMNFKKWKKPETPSFLEKLRSHDENPDRAMLVYAMSGEELPDIKIYNKMSGNEKRTYWEERFSVRLGKDWRDKFQNPPSLNFVDRSKRKHRWLTEGY